MNTAAQFERAYLAWDTGDYVNALQGFKSVLNARDGGAYFDRIALATGELYRTTELASDGRQPRFSPDGRYLSLETGSPAVTRLLEVATPSRAVAELPGSGAAFSPQGSRVVYFRLKADSTLAALRQDIERLQAQPAPDRQKLADLQRQLVRATSKQSEIVVRDLTTGGEKVLPDGGMLKSALTWSSDGSRVYFVGTADGDAKSNDVYGTSESSGEPRAVTSGPGFKTSPFVARGGRYLLYSVSQTSPFATAGPGGGRMGGPGGGAGRQFVLQSLSDNVTTPFNASMADVSADGSKIVFVSQAGTDYTVQVATLGAKFEPKIVKKSTDRIASATISPDASRLAFDMPISTGRNTEIFTVKSDGSGEFRVSREIQPDRAPRFLTNTTLIAIKGESRHSRSYLYDLDGAPPVRLFHNNTVRTIAPEYEWVPGADGKHLLVVAQRSGDTISPARGVYLVDLTSRVSRDELLGRVEQNLAAERDLRARGTAMFQPISAQVKRLTAQVSVTRLWEYEDALFACDSKYIGLPGNQKAADYIFATLKSFGYEPEYQWFTTRDRMSGGEIRTANVLATLKGTTNPELVYVLGSHYDSVQRSPGGDDDDTGIAVLLENARVLAGNPMPATIVFAAFTGEEAGELGSHEFVRQAVERKMKLVGALNNDMIGWTNDYRLDNTIRYANPGMRDLQHAAAFLFSKMITYDARWVRGTDAQSYWDVWGPMVSGMGSYPVLGNPYYHQSTDLLETVNQHLLFEATKANLASLMGLASSPTPVGGIKSERTKTGAVTVSWNANPEKNIAKYVVNYSVTGKTGTTLVTTATHALLPASAGAVEVAVKAVNAVGLSSWDRAKTTVAAKSGT